MTEETMAVSPEKLPGNIRAVFSGLHEYLVKNDFKGWEYDDLLASPLVKTLTMGLLYPSIAAVQVAKRSPVNVRPVLGVPKLKSTKAFGFIIKGYLFYELATGDGRYREFAVKALDWLLTNHSKGYSGYCWGNDFDFASRAGFFRKGLPTIVWTSHIQEAFALAFDVTKEQKYLDAVHSAAEFIYNDLHRIKDDSGFCFAYAPGINFPIHNSNLLGAAALARSYHYRLNESYADAISSSCKWSVSKQNSDGSWYYGSTEMLQWIDNYHTGYNLDCLMEVNRILGNEFVSEDVIAHTYKFWTSELFDPGMAPRFYNNSSYPRDIQATAQAIESFCKYSVRDPSALENARAVFSWACLNMLKENGSFAYRLYRSGKRNDLEAIHWGQATMLSAMGHLFYYHSDKREKR